MKPKEQSYVPFPKVRDFLKAGWMKYWVQNEGEVTVKSFSLACRVSDTNMGRYIKGTQMPGPETQDRIAVVLGPGIYAACDAPMRVPPIPALIDIVSLFVYLSDEEQILIRDKVKELVENRNKPLILFKP